MLRRMLYRNKYCVHKRVGRTSDYKAGLRCFQKIAAQIGRPDARFHDLRHSFASLAYNLGLLEKVTMELGGWNNDQTMRKIYTYIAKQDLDSSTKTFTNFFAPTSKKESA